MILTTFLHTNPPQKREGEERKNIFLKNEIYYYVATKEISIDINDVSGNVYLPYN